MADGYLGKCKDCAKKDTEDRRKEKEKDPAWVEAEYDRHRLKARLYRANGITMQQTPEKRRETSKKYDEKYPEKRNSHTILGNALRDGKIKRMPCVVCGATGAEGHHDDYLKPLDIMWLCPKHHYERHVHLRKMARLSKLNTP